MTKDGPHLVGLNDIYAAQEVIHPHLHRTPVAGASYLGERVNATLFFKLEMFQKTGSFKPRGVLNNMHNLSGEEKRLGVISLSAGNHAQALAYAASMSGIPATIVMPANAVTSKVEATRGYGGEVVLTSDDLMETTLEIQRQRNLTLVHPFDSLDTIAGTGTLGLELLDDLPYADVVVVGIGGGGLISGVAAAIKLNNPNVRVIGVEPEGAPGMTRSLASGVPEHLDTLDTIADGLAAPFVGQHNLDHVQAFVDDVVLVSDAQIAEAMGLILERGKVLAEAAAASTYAALLSGKVSLSTGETVVCVLSGGNVDVARLVSILGG
ncbi:MAG: threonine/serine dehydratase [SAR202 cluster bacterium]|jgi:threonine dehydratase|nr:threonine/serine dehydratase [SAR202 cluster bacterium]MDP6514303.1 threonine/serine dehydratase [SAR202 cluster bacterium]MDP6714162.1 threonine/serine dehydratase [SAR202 cluster bacterium]